MSTILDNLMNAVPHMAPSSISFEEWRTSESPQFIGLTHRPPVPNSEDVERVVKLPRRPQVNLSLGSEVSAAMVNFMNARLRRPDWQRKDCRCRSYGRDCITTLQPAQAWALYEAPIAGGLMGLLATGSGKTAVGLLMSMVMPDCKKAVGLVPSNLVEQLVREYRLWDEHWILPSLIWGKSNTDIKPGRPVLHIVPYSRLSMPESTTLFKALSPDLVYADEMDKLANTQAARTIRFIRAFREVPETRLCGWTGTPWDKSILECGHLSAFALKMNSPLPLDPQTTKVWAVAIDPSEKPAGAGALRQLCEPHESLHQGFHRRLVETLGVVATREGAINIPLHLYERAPGPLPPELTIELDKLRGATEEDGAERPDGEELVDALEIARVARELVSGFYYRWIFPKEPRGKDGKLTPEAIHRIELWRERRKAWRKELRVKIAKHEEYLDSERLCTDAAERFYQTPKYEGDLPVWKAEHYLPWVEVKDSIEYETEAVWISDYLLEDAAAWAKQHRGIIWTEHDAWAERLGFLTGLPVHRGGPNAEKRILAEKGDRSIIASIDSHGRGRDGLQYLFHEQLLTSPPSSGRMTEQVLARLHRVGQPHHEVNTWFYDHVPEFSASIEKATRRAEFAQDTWGASQKVLHAQWHR